MTEQMHDLHYSERHCGHSWQHFCITILIVNSFFNQKTLFNDSGIVHRELIATKFIFVV